MLPRDVGKKARRIGVFSRRVIWHASSTAVMVVVLTLALGGTGRADPNPFEQEQIEARALEAFRVMVALWREELYFELYDLGSEATRGRITREEFAQRMVELSYVPKGELNPKYLKSKLRFRTLVYIATRIEYRHKFDVDRTFHRDHGFLLLEEDSAWRVDLIQLIRAPYAR